MAKTKQYQPENMKRMYMIAICAWVLVMATALPGTTYLWQNSVQQKHVKTITLSYWNELKKMAALFY
jgi:hypothetical protein